MYDFYIFDLDGTLLDTLDDLASSVNATLKRFGYPPRSKEEVCNFVGNGVKLLLIRAIGYEPANFLEIFEYFKEYYSKHSADQTKPYVGVLELLQRLKSQGKKTAIVSNKSDFATKSLSKKYFDGLINVTLGENEDAGIRKKPAPDSVELALKEMGISKEKSVYIGDSDVDIQTAKNAGLACISVTWGFRNEQFLRENGGICFAHSPNEIK
ncbi:MAG: HAD family hydrolase [Clostridia bacterium]|nr:HAD family hydrolase [Clostridia bacterium]